jgi:hypothetical protein
MTNLIPPESKKQLIRLYLIRVVSAWAILWAAALFIGALLMYPTYLLISGISAAYEQTAAGVIERTEAYDKMVVELDKSNQEAKAIVRATDQVKLSALLLDIWSVNGQGIEISGVQLSRGAQGLAPIGLTGEAADRQALASFRDRIESLPYVEQVNLPIENLAKNQDIGFTITVTVNLETL